MYLEYIQAHQAMERLETLSHAVDYSEKFMKDVLGCNVAAVYESGKYKV